jgi:hypothetical protein
MDEYEQLAERLHLAERALADYIEKYGLSDLARQALIVPSVRQPKHGHSVLLPERNGSVGPGQSS